jgi:hypothetical protein
MKTAADYIKALALQPHPEGGYFAETYRSDEMIPHDALPSRFRGARSFGTAIYFLLESHHESALHRIQSDEIWHFYDGDPLEIYVIDSVGAATIIRLGRNLENGEVFQAVVPAGNWFGAKPIINAATINAGYVLVGCTVAPGFDFADFELAKQS